MNFSDFFNGIISFGEALAIIPATVLCFIPMRHQLRFSVKRVICYGAVLVFACTVYMAIALRYFSGIMENLPLLLGIREYLPDLRVVAVGILQKAVNVALLCGGLNLFGRHI